MGRNEAVAVEHKLFGFLPQVFVWRGDRYDVRRVERCWTVARGSGPNRLERRYFRLHCDRGVFEIYHDLVANAWRMGRAASVQGSAASEQMMPRRASCLAGNAGRPKRRRQVVIREDPLRDGRVNSCARSA